MNREEKESSKFCIDKLVLSLVSHTNKVREPNAFELFFIKYRNTLNLTEIRILCLGLLSLAGAFISGYRSMERLGVFFAPCESIARFYPMLNSAVSIYTPDQEGALKVKCLAQVHNMRTLVRFQPGLTQS